MRCVSLCVPFPAVAALAGNAAAEPRPDIIFIVADDTGYTDTGFQGSKDIPTPNLDALAKSGVPCTNGHALRETGYLTDIFGREAKERRMDVNMIPFLMGEKPGAPHKALFWRAGGGDPWAVRDGDLKLVLNRGATGPELCDPAADISEANDLAAFRPDDVKRLDALRASWNARLVPPAFSGPAGGKKNVKKTSGNQPK